jgi:hypothetical protein
MYRARLSFWWQGQRRWLRGLVSAVVIIFVVLVFMRVHPLDALWGAAILGTGHGVAIWISDKFRARLRP